MLFRSTITQPAADQITIQWEKDGHQARLEANLTTCAFVWREDGTAEFFN